MSSKNLLFEVSPLTFNKTVKVPSSKSYANRAIILACLRADIVEVKNLPLSHDVTNLIDCLRGVGLEILEIEDGIRIMNSFPECERPIREVTKVYPGDGGTTTRFLIPFLALGKNKYQVEPTGRMRERPITDLLDNLIGFGVKVDRSDSWLTINGPLSLAIESIDIDASKTTQHATALALAFAFQKVAVNPINMSSSTSYWIMTKNLIQEFKTAKDQFIVPVDFSSMSYILALGADLGSVRVENCFSIDHDQADSVFIEVLERIGYDVSLNKNGLRVSTSEELGPIDFDCSDCPDLVPTLSFICSRIDGRSKLRNLSVLKYKESDRLLEIQKVLRLFGVEYSYDSKNDSMIIDGSIERVERKISINPPDDHRIVMMSYLFLRSNGGGTLSSVESVSKSFANFFEVVENEA